MLNLLLTTLLATQPPAPAQAPAPAPSAPTATAPAPELPELLALKAENHLLRLRLLQLQTQLEQDALARQRAELDAAITAAHPGYRMDWSTGQLVPVAADDKEPRP